jgi:TolA-binding protein
MEAGERNPSAFLAEEEIADTLARMGKHAEAAAAYGAVLQQYPQRAHALLGRARAAAAARDTKTAKAAYQQLVELWSAADATTPGLDEARKALATP